MAQHTPGPWVLELENNPKGFQKILGGHWGMHNIAQVVKRQSMKDEDEANVQLVASSPDLLAALRDMVEFCATNDNFIDGEFPVPEFITQAHAAIAKAEGRA